MSRSTVEKDEIDRVNNEASYQISNLILLGRPKLPLPYRITCSMCSFNISFFIFHLICREIMCKNHNIIQTIFENINYFHRKKKLLLELINRSVEIAPFCN